MRYPRVKFVQAIGKLAKIEGSAECTSVGIDFEIAMTDSPSGRVDGILKRTVTYLELEDVQLRRRIFRRSRLIFSARRLEGFESIPCSKGYQYTVTPIGPSQEVRSFVAEARLAIAEATMERFTTKIEETVMKGDARSDG